MQDYKSRYNQPEKKDSIIPVIICMIIIFASLGYFIISGLDSLSPTKAERECTAEYYTPLCEEK